MTRGVAAAEIHLDPAEFTLVHFDRDRLLAVARTVAVDCGFGDETVHLEVDETTPRSRSRVEGDRPLRLSIESGALEDPLRPRCLSEVVAAEVIGRHLLQTADRRDPSFEAPADGDELSLAQRTAWDIWALARLSRLGYGDQQARWRYHFRNRCGFTDAADVAFDRLWNAESMTWPAIEALVEAASAR